MTRRIFSLSIPIAAALLSLATAPSAQAQETEPGARFELFGGRVEPTDSDVDVDTSPTACGAATAAATRGAWKARWHA